jgi:hypothetical protein
MLSVLISRAVWTWRNALRWQIDPVPQEKRLVTLLARLDTSNDHVHDYHVLPNVNRPRRFTIKYKDEWLQRGLRIAKLQQLFDAVATVRERTAHGR